MQRNGRNGTWPCGLRALLLLAALLQPAPLPAQEAPPTIDQTDPEFWERTQARVADLAAEAFVVRAGFLLSQVTPAEHEQALLLLQQAARLYPEDPVVLAEFARAAVAPYRWVWDRDENWIRRGRGLLEKAHGIDPELPEVLRTGGLIAMLDNRLEDAEAALRSALDARPTDLESLLLLGAVLRLQDRYREAYAVYDRAVEEAPSDWRSYAGMGDVYRDDAWYDEALNLYAKASGLHAGAFAPRFGEVTVYQRTGFYPIVNKKQLELLRDFPDWENLVLLVAAAWHMRVGEPDAALEELEQIQMGGRRGLCQGTILYRIGVCRRRLGDRDGALEALRAAVDEYPDARDGSDYGPLVLFSASRELAMIYEELGRPQEAIGILERAASREEAPLSVRLRLASKLADFALHERAAAVLDQAIAGESETEPLFARLQVRVDLARQLAASGDDGSAAREHLERIEPEVREQGVASDFYAMARGYSLGGDRERGMRWLQQAVEAGYVHYDTIRDEADLEPLREMKAYRSLMKGR